MNERTTLVVEGEGAAKLFDFFLSYKKLAGMRQLSEETTTADTVSVGLMPEIEIAEEVKASQ